MEPQVGALEGMGVSAVSQVVNQIRRENLTGERANPMLNCFPLLPLEQRFERTISWYREFLRVAA